MNLFTLCTPDLAINSLTDEVSEHVVRPSCPAQAMLGFDMDDSFQLNLTTFHKEILSDAQKTWYQPLPNSFSLDDNQRYQKQACLILDQVSQNQNLVVHDPLLCRFLPLWSSLDALVLLHYSEPLECAITLQNKWRFPLSVGLALWESYVLDAVKNLQAHKYVLLSSKKCRNSGKPYIKSVAKKLEKASSQNLNIIKAIHEDPAQFVGALSADYADLLEHVQNSQRVIFDALEKGKLSKIKKLNISKQSADILQYYGQMRSGFEMVKAQRDKIKNELAASQQQRTKTAETTEVDLVANKSEQQKNLIAVKLGLRGMHDVEFFSEPDSPILEMLQQHLLSNSQAQDEMIYLNSVGADNEAMYFMASSLLTIETQSVSQH